MASYKAYLFVEIEEDSVHPFNTVCKSLDIAQKWICGHQFLCDKPGHLLYRHGCNVVVAHHVHFFAIFLDGYSRDAPLLAMNLPHMRSKVVSDSFPFQVLQ